MDISATVLGPQIEPVSFSFNRRSSGQKFSGLRQLAQQFAFLLLKSPSSDKTSLGIGGGLVDSLKFAGSAADVEALCHSCVIDTDRQMRDAQATSGVSYSKSEKLKSTSLKDIEVISDIGGVKAVLTILITSEDNQVTVAPIEVSI